jgi:hypothetical protein
MMIELEQPTARKLSWKFVNDISTKVGLPADVCETLLQSGWTLETEANKPAMWVQAWPNELKAK